MTSYPFHRATCSLLLALEWTKSSQLGAHLFRVWICLEQDVPGTQTSVEDL